MYYLLLVVALLAVAVLVYLATLPADFEIRRSLLMNAERQRVFDKVRDLRSWCDWSPWIIHEPDAALTYSGDTGREGGCYGWDGRHIGAGTLTHVRLQAPDRIEQRIAFRRPFRSDSEVWWEFADRNGETEATWGMRGRMPFFFRFMTGMMIPMIEKDYDLGLARLRGILDPRAERPEIRFLGATQAVSRTVLAIPFGGGLEDLKQAMQEGYPRLLEQVRGQGREPAGQPLCAYDAFDPKTTQLRCDMALPVTEDTAPGGFVRKRIGGGRTLSVEVRGSYDFLGLAWYSAFAHLRMYKLKQDKRRPLLETYENDPRSVAHGNEIRTRLDIPIR